MPKENYPTITGRRSKRSSADIKRDASKKQEGLTAEHEADPIPFPLYRKICNWSITEGNIYVWCWTILQWTCVGRASSIDPLGFHNFSLGVSDSIKVLYDKSKADNEGEKVTPKNLYTDPLDPKICPFLSLGVYCCLFNNELGRRESLFLRQGKAGSASSKYCLELRKVLLKHQGEVSKYLRNGHDTNHGIRKGGPTHALTCITAPPSLVSVAQRGEWSMGAVFDIYWNYGDAGDQYLGRVLSGLDPSKESFSVLPPHFLDTEQSEVDEALTICFGEILRKHPKSKGPLLLCLASIVYHFDFLNNIRAESSGHELNKIIFFSVRCDLITKLKPLVTINESPEMRPTGIPPHVDQLKKISKILASIEILSTKFDKIGNYQIFVLVFLFAILYILNRRGNRKKCRRSNRKGPTERWKRN